MATYSDLVQWCLQARELLKSTGSKKGVAALAFDEALNRVTSELGKLTRLVPEAEVVGDLEARFRALAGQARKLAERGQKEDPAKLREPAKKLSDELDKLADDAKAALPQLQKRLDYGRLLADCRRQKASLDTFPYADTSDVAKVISDATLDNADLDDAGNVTQALKTLAGFTAAVELAKKKQLQGAKNAEANIKAERDCLERQAALNALLERAKSGLGNPEMAQQLQAALNKAKPSLDKKEWASALRELNAKGLPDVQALDKARQSKLGTLPQQPLKQINELLAQYKTLIDDEAFADAKQRADEHIAEALDFDPRGAAQMLEATVVQINSKVVAATRYQQELQALMQKIDAGMLTAKTLVPVDEALALQGDHDQVKNRQGQRQLVLAHELATRLEPKLTKAVTDGQTRKAAWAKISGAYDNGLKTLRGLIQDPAKSTPEARLRVSELLLAAGEGRKVTLESLRDWTGLIGIYRQVEVGIAAFQTTMQQYAAFAEERRKANEAYGKAVKALQPEIDKTRQALVAAGVDVNAVLAPLGESLQRAQQDWVATLANATGEGSLKAQAHLDVLAKLRQDIVSAGEPGSVKAKAQQQADERDRAAFEREAEVLPAEMLKLEHLDPLAGEAFAERLATLRSTTAMPWAERLAPLKTLISEVRQKVAQREKERPQQAGKLTTQLEQLEQRLQTEKGKLKSSGDKTFAPLFTQLADELADLRVLVATPNLEVNKSTAKRLGEIEGQLKSIEALSSSGGSAFKPVREELERLDKSVSDARSTLKENVPKSLASLEQLQTRLKAAVLSMTPQEAFDEINAIRESLNRARTEAGKVARRRAAYLELLPLVTQKIDLLARERTVGPYVEALRKRLAEVRKQGTDPNKLDSARQQLDLIHRDVEAAILDPAKGLQMQKAVLDEAERKRLLEVQAKSTLADLKKSGLPRARKAVNDKGGDTALVAEIERMIGAVEEIMKSKAPDHAEALRRMRLVEQRIAEVEADPFGPGIGARKDLPNDAKLFGDSARKLVAALGGFPQKVAASLQPPEAVTKKLQQLVSDLSGRIDADQFVQPALQLSDGKQPIRQRRELRESMLQRVRTLTAMLNEQPQFHELWANPIDVELAVAAKEVNQRLRRLEANIRRAVH